MARITLPAITVAIDDNAEHSSTTIGAIGGYVVVVATALPERGITLTSSYLAAMVGDTGRVSSMQLAGRAAAHRAACPPR